MVCFFIAFISGGNATAQAMKDSSIRLIPMMQTYLNTYQQEHRIDAVKLPKVGDKLRYKAVNTIQLIPMTTLNLVELIKNKNNQPKDSIRKK
jgi:hypothetical protein